jgi:DNA-binding transcriptional regulator YdaS (Cro superfamily)
VDEVTYAPKLFTASDVRRLLRRACIDAGKQEAVAALCGVSGAYISQVMLGKKPPGPSIARGLGLERVVAWRLK